MGMLDDNPHEIIIDEISGSKEDEELKKHIGFGKLLAILIIAGSFAVVFALMFAVVKSEQNSDWLCVKYAPINASKCLVCEPSPDLRTNLTKCSINTNISDCKPDCMMEVKVRYGDKYKNVSSGNNSIFAR